MISLCALEPAAPWTILAITFTNKAAGELKDRLSAMLGPEAEDVWASTFHSACVRILRRDIEKLGFASSFTIYDTDDSLRVIKTVSRNWNWMTSSSRPGPCWAISLGPRTRCCWPRTTPTSARSWGLPPE